MRLKDYVKLGKNDNVVVLTKDAIEGSSLNLENREILLKENIKAGHKVAIRPIKKGTYVIKYDHRVGKATRDINPGEWVHTHNVKTTLSEEQEYRWNPRNVTLNVSVPRRSFFGYRRESGRVGIRNDLWIIPTVGCINRALLALVKRYNKKPWIDEVKILTHPFGCSQLGEDLEMAVSVLTGLARNPNAAGVVFVGLGCENLQIDVVKERTRDLKNVRYMVMQKSVDDFKMLSDYLDELSESTARRREKCDVSDLIIGVKCGGSDAFSGVTANPLVGKLSDYVVYHGGAVLVSEIPEMFGAEDVLISRITNREVFNEFIRMIEWFKNYYLSYGQPIYENPSPGNKEGGISTLEEKSLGAIEKAGNGPVNDVLWYGQAVKSKGVSIVFGPGNDLVSSTSLVSSGAQLILFTTGRGTPFGTVVPTIKISSNSGLVNKKNSWIDFDASKVLDVGWETVTEELIDFVLNVASGRRTKNEINGIHEIAIFKNGVIL